MRRTSIEVVGARTHNLKDIDVSIPKGRIVAFTGLSGSGKSSLVFDTIYTEAQRQLVETFSTYARRRLPQLSRPPVEHIANLSPCIVIDQKRLGRNSRSTVGTVTEIYTFLRMLFSRCGHPFIGWSHRFSFNHPEGMCPGCKGLGQRLRVLPDRLLDPELSIEGGAIQHPEYAVGKWYWRELVHTTPKVVPTNRALKEFSPELRQRLLWADGIPIHHTYRGKTSQRSFEGVARKLERLHLEKNEAQWSKTRRAAFERFFKKDTCTHCGGSRLRPEARSVRLADGSTLEQLVALELTELDHRLQKLIALEALPLPEVTVSLVEKIRSRVGHLIDIGVGYLSLDRSVASLSGGESQRVKMAKQLECSLVDMLYILDEPSVGLHPQDVAHLIGMLRRLRDQGNSVLVVEHDLDVVRAADWIVELGPGAGEGGGELTYAGPADGLADSATATASLLGKATSPLSCRRTATGHIRLENLRRHNLKNLRVSIPTGVFACLTGVAGSGKSSLVGCFLDEATAQPNTRVVAIDQSAPGRSHRSCPATYLGIFDAIRRLFAETTGHPAKHFSFNSGGACPTCKGRGSIEMELSFLDDIDVPCSDCGGRRYTNAVLAQRVAGKNIHEVLSLSVEQALRFFVSRELPPQRSIVEGLRLLEEVGLHYLRLGQSLSTLSGGECQRLKLAKELRHKGSIYVMDEPTTGLHGVDVQRLLGIVQRLVDAGNTVLVVEHNLAMICAADWLIDLGPQGGRAGGHIVAEGPPETVAKVEGSITGRFVAAELAGKNGAFKRSGAVP